MTARGLTAVAGIEVGQAAMSGRPTGCTVILASAGAVAAVDVRGGAPATRETDLLRPENLVQKVHGVVLSGGSAFGLDAASGVMRFLEKREIGFAVGRGVVPIVVGASLFDLAVGEPFSLRPDADCGFRAATAASSAPVVEGSVGAGLGATVGKLLGIEYAMRGGLGSSALEPSDGLVVAALIVVNAVGDIVDPVNNAVIAGVRGDHDELLDARRLVRAGRVWTGGFRENTTIGVVATNARLDKAQAYKVAVMAHDGLARTISPAHTLSDGDAIFVLATGDWSGEVNVSRIGALAAEVVADSVVRAVRSADSLPGLPAAKDLWGPR